jgi:hypothetical protein
LARSAVNGISRFPSPPARTIAKTFFDGMMIAPERLLLLPNKVRQVRTSSH